jgi:hypothetical protein
MLVVWAENALAPVGEFRGGNVTAIAKTVMA